MFKSFVIVLLLSLIFLGCSSKEYYDPKDTVDTMSISGELESRIVEISGADATLADGKIISQKGIDTTQFPLGYRFVFKNDDWTLALKVGGEIFAIKDENTSKTIKLSKTIATLALRDNLLAVVFADNELALYDFETEKLLFKEPASDSTVVDMRIANPKFLNELILFPTLDGKLVIVNADEKELVRTIIVSSEQYFNNIIYFKIINDVLYAATPSKVYSLGEKEVRLDLESRNIVVNENGIWVATKQGEIVSLDHDLNILNKDKFPFAHFLGMVVTNEAIYVAEKEEYIIVIKPDFSSFEVYDFDLEDGFFFTTEKGFYFGSQYINF